MDTLPIDIWSDIACPWCYVGKRRLEIDECRAERAQQPMAADNAVCGPEGCG